MPEVRASARIELVGAVTKDVAQELRRRTDSLADVPQLGSLTIDLRASWQFGADGVAAILHADAITRTRGVALRLDGAPPDVRALLRLTGLDRPDLYL